MSSELGPFPVDEVTLNNLKHALDGVYTIDDEGNPKLINAEFSVSQLLEWLSGYDKSKLILESEGYEVPDDAPFSEQAAGAALYTYPDPVYGLHDVIRALIEEIERLRGHDVG